MRNVLPCLMTLALLLCAVDNSDVVRAPLEQSRPSYNFQRDSNLDRLVDRQWQDQQKSVDGMRRKSEQEILQRQKSGQQPVPPVKK